MPTPILFRSTAGGLHMLKKFGRRKVFDAAAKTSHRPNVLTTNRRPIANWSAIIDNHLPTTENLRKPPNKKVVVGGRREVVDVIL